MFHMPRFRMGCVLWIYLATVATHSYAQDLQTGAAFLNSCSLINLDVGNQKVSIDHGQIAIHMQHRPGRSFMLLEVPAVFISQIVIGIDPTELRTLSFAADVGYHFDCKTPGCIKGVYRELNSKLNDLGYIDFEESQNITVNFNSFRWNTCDAPSSTKALEGIGAHLIRAGFTLEETFSKIIFRAPK